MKLGVVGLPNVGKSTLFNAITKAGAECANYPFCTIEANVGVVAVPDGRLEVLGNIYHSKKVTPAVIKFVDIAGLVKGASKGEGLGNKFLSHIREVDAIVHLVRAFEGNVTHVSDTLNPTSDMETINWELAFADLDTVNSRLDKARSLFKTGDKRHAEVAKICEKLIETLEQGRPVRSINLTPEEREVVDEMWLLTAKPMIYVANVGEGDLGKSDSKMVEAVKKQAAEENTQVVVLCAKVEEELTHLDDEEKQLFYESYGIARSGLEVLVEKGYALLGLISYLTAGEKETRAWTIKQGTKAPQAAGKIHTDFEKGFIRAEVATYDTIVECGGYQNARDKGRVRSEGKDYVVKDGDVILFLTST